MRYGALIVVTAMLAACSGKPADPIEEENTTLKIRAEIALESKLRDPKSAEIESFVSRISGSPVVCGTVNAKNAFGGYTGRQLFVFAGDRAVLAEEIGAESFAGFWADNCKDLTG